MTKREFEALLGQKVPASHWETIEPVYMWHPSFKTLLEPEGATSDLYRTFGIGPFQDMYQTAIDYRTLCEAVESAKCQLDKAVQEREDFENELLLKR